MWPSKNYRFVRGLWRIDARTPTFPIKSQQQNKCIFPPPTTASMRAEQWADRDGSAPPQILRTWEFQNA